MGSSQHTYKSGEKRFLCFCDSCHVTPLPVSEDVLCKFVSHLADSDLKHRTIKTYLSGVRYYNIRSGFPDPFQSSHMPRLDYTLRGVKRVQAQKGGTQRSRLPITPSLLRLMKGVWAPSTGRDEKMIWVACCLAFFGFLRIGEMTVPDGSGFDPSVHLGVWDIAVDHARSPSFLRITIKQSKTDPLPQRGGAVCRSRQFRFVPCSCSPQLLDL